MIQSARKCLIIGVFVSVLASFAGAWALDVATPRLKPPAPGPQYLSRADYTQLLALDDLLKRKRFTETRSVIDAIGDPSAKTLGWWMYYRAEDPTVNIDQADLFLDSHQDWPAIDSIQSFVEGRIPWTAPTAQVLAFFDKRDPVSGDGKILLAKALYDHGDNEAAGKYLRDGWINHNFTLSEERRILAVLGGRLNEDDHAARVDRMLWERQVTNARRIFPKLDSSHRRMAEARAAFLLRASVAPKLYRDLSLSEQQDSGVLMAAARYYRRSGDEEKALEISGQAPNDPKALRNPGRWWYERQLLMRWALREGRFGDAYALAANNGLEDNTDLAEAEFNAGWIALRFLHEPERAETHFLALASAVESPISLSRAYYWLGRTEAAKNDAKASTAYYQKAAQYYYSFYGQLASEALGEDIAQRRFGPVAVSTAEDRARFEARPTVTALRMLSDLGLDYEFMVFAYHIDDQLERPGEYVELAKIANGEGATHLTVRAGKVAVRRNAFAANVAYPMVFVPDEAKRFVPPEMILGLSRQESEFNPRAFSRAGARGMMQLLPATALTTARKEGLRYSRNALLDDPVYNLTIGAAHLSHLLDQFGGSIPLTLAAYNAGPHRADRWIKEYGDPRSPNVDPLDWIELVPFAETRNYIQRVLENTQVYRGQLNNAPIPGSLAADIERGGPSGRLAKNYFPSTTVLPNVSTSQVLPPVPQRTKQRAQEFVLAQAEAASADTQAPLASPGPEAQENPVQKPRRRNRRGAGSRSQSPTPGNTNATLTQPPAGAQITPETDPAASETPVPTAVAPIALSVEPADETIGISDTESVTASPLPAAVVASEAIVENQADALGALIEDATADASLAPEENDEASEGVDSLAQNDECAAYLEFLARNAGEEEEIAANLNAIILAQMQFGEECDVDDLSQ